MTRFKACEAWLNWHRDQTGVGNLHDYLRDLKASHDVLLKAYKSHADFCDDDLCRSCETERTIIKTAEGLK